MSWPIILAFLQAVAADPAVQTLESQALAWLASKITGGTFKAAHGTPPSVSATSLLAEFKASKP